MKRLFVLALLVGAFTCGLYAQAVNTTVCDILKNPKSFDGKIVSIKGTVVAGYDEFIVKDPTACGFQVDGIWLSYPVGTKGKAGPVALMQVQPAHNFAGTYTAPTRVAVTLDKSKDFKQFDSLLAQAHTKGGGMCLGCAANTVSATLVGRLDGVENATLARDKAGKIIGFGGFGNLNAYPARLVLQSVADVKETAVDFSKSDEITKKSMTPPGGGPAEIYDPIEAAGKSIARLAGSPAGALAEKDVAAFGKHGEHNGVSIAYTAINEANPKDEALGAKDSPDGILFNCIFNMNRLEGDAQVRSIIHMGQHVTDLRNPAPGNEDAPLYVLEYNAWSLTAADAISVGQSFLTIPGGYLLWNSTWAVEDRNLKMDDALKSYLANYAAITR